MFLLRELVLELFVLGRELRLLLEAGLDLGELVLQLEGLRVARVLPLVVHEKAQALRVKLVCLVVDELVEHVSQCRLLLLLLERRLVRRIGQQ